MEGGLWVWEILEGQVCGESEVLLGPWKLWLWVSVVDLGPGLEAQTHFPSSLLTALSWVLSWQRVLTPIPAGCLLCL